MGGACGSGFEEEAGGFEARVLRINCLAELSATWQGHRWVKVSAAGAKLHRKICKGKQVLGDASRSNEGADQCALNRGALRSHQLLPGMNIF